MLNHYSMYCRYQTNSRSSEQVQIEIVKDLKRRKESMEEVSYRRFHNVQLDKIKISTNTVVIRPFICFRIIRFQQSSMTNFSA